ncbi:FAD-binding domain protein [Ceratobasidium sp. AG-Ba]|nr:FAD-binding domain protein [Ceratobasidium sp. AG-Ba]
MAPNSVVDVLIIGAGPAGLMCAYNLAQAGVKIRIVDQRQERMLKGQADVIQVRGIEILDSLNLASKIIPSSYRAYTFTTYKGNSEGSISRIGRADSLYGIESPYRFSANNSQSFIEGVFRDALASGEKIIRGLSFEPEKGIKYSPRSVFVEQGVRPTSLVFHNENEAAYPVEVELKDSNGSTEFVKAKYVIGCGGAHSWTRAQLGIEMVGENSNSTWGLVDVTVDTDFPDIRNMTVVENNGRRAVVVPRENDSVRFTVQLTDAEVGKDPVTGRVDRAKVTEEKLLQIVKDVFKPYRIDFVGKTWWHGVYVVGQRLAPAYEGGNGRAFIVGDACHTHSPHAGQGMNAALSDGHNLAWKLVHVLRGWASPELLHTYEQERRAFAKDLIHLHERIAEAMSGKVKGTNADIISNSLGFVCGTSIQYEPTCLTDLSGQVLAKGIPIGQRLPHQVILRVADCRPYSTHDLLQCDFRYTVLLFTGDIKLAIQHEALEAFLQGLGSDRTTFKVFTILQVPVLPFDYVY